MLTNTGPRIPHVRAYKHALQDLRSHLSDGQFAMLYAQYLAPAHTMTATELATAACYKSYHGANLQYGLMSYRLRERLG